MNERITDLHNQAIIFSHNNGGLRISSHIPNDYMKKFAELIVAECAGLCNQAAEESARTFYTVTETKEGGPALVAKGSQVQAEKLSKQIKQHFGVKE